jgi:hypothetical protein
MSDLLSSELLLAACMFLGAVLYTSVGHTGASAYIAQGEMKNGTNYLNGL